MPTIVMRRGPEPGRVFHVEEDIVKIGRGRKNDIIIHDNEVSREHCNLVRVGNDYELRDLGSSNGTFVNGQRVTTDGWLLKSDCLIEIGDSITLEFVVGSARYDFAGPSLHPYLIVLVESSPGGPEVYPLDGELISVGRDLNCTIVIQEPEVSRNHMQLHYSDLGYMVEDLGSTNGTRINGEMVDVPRLLRVNDVIQIGSMVKLLYTDDPTHFLADSKTDILPHLEDDETIQKKIIDSSQLLERIKLRTETSESELGLGFEPGSLSGHVFIAYARRDWSTVVAQLYAFLEDHQLPAWVDQYLNEDADDWEVALNHVLTECSILLVVVSDAALNTDYIRRSWRYFHAREKPIILLIYERGMTLPMELRNVPTITFDSNDPDGTYMEVVAEIMRFYP